MAARMAERRKKSAKIEKDREELRLLRNRVEQMREEEDNELLQMERQINVMRDGCSSDDADVLSLLDEKEAMIVEFRQRQMEFLNDFEQYAANEEKRMDLESEEFRQSVKGWQS